MHADLAGPEAHTRHDVQRGTEIKGQVQHRRSQASLRVGSPGHDAPRRQMLQQTRITVSTGEPVVTERDPGQIQPRFRGVHHSWQAGEGQITTQNPVRTATGEGGDELADAGHPLTLADASAPQSGPRATAPRTCGAGRCSATVWPRPPGVAPGVEWRPRTRLVAGTVARAGRTAGWMVGDYVDIV